MTERVGIIGLGYVGLPVAVAFARAFPGTIGFDINQKKIAALQGGHDETGGIASEDLIASKLRLTSDPAELSDCTFLVVAVPTPIDGNRQPDLRPIISASELAGRALRPGAVVVYESTVYPGVTEQICGPILARVSGLRQGVDFKLGYSPERINPGDREHTLECVVKVVSAEDNATLERVASAYEKIVTAGVFRAETIKVAEAAKVIENTQRDLNIALMNELALIFDRIGLRTSDVLRAASTKWNFLRFAPGLVGGHCIGVDPYYLTAMAEAVGYRPEVILAGRRINDNMGRFLAQRLVKLIVNANRPVKGARVAILGLSFKEDVPDIRNSRVPDIVRELKEFGIDPQVCEPLADGAHAQEEYGIQLTPFEELKNLDALVLAVAHKAFLELPVDRLVSLLQPGGVLMDVKSRLDPGKIDGHVTYWSL